MTKLSLFLDISGRVTRQNETDIFFTVCCVIIPNRIESLIRDLLPEDFPKWKEATIDSLSLIAKILSEHEIYCVVLVIEKNDPEWGCFWANGKNQTDTLSRQLKGRIGFAQPGNVIKYMAFGKCAIMALELYLNNKGRSRFQDPDDLESFYLSVICDTDILGDMNQMAFTETWNCWSNLEPRNTFRIKPVIQAVEFKTEEEEPIINLPDYFAGIIHYLSHTKKYLLDELSLSQIQVFNETIRLSEKLCVERWLFKEIFPNLTCI